MGLFYSRLSYSIGNEDSATEAKALTIQPDDRVLCVTASGDRTLNLLSHPCREIVSIDVNPIQNHLLELKHAAMELLSFPNYMAFLGLTPYHNRAALFARIALHLSPRALKFWHTHFHLIDRGVIHQGFTEKFVRFFARPIHVVQGRAIEELFTLEKIEDQRSFVAERWNTKFWEKTLNVLLHPVVSRYLIKDPGLYLNQEKTFHPGKYIFQKILNYLDRHLANQSLLLSLIMLGKVLPSAYTPYLTREGIENIRPQLDKITIKTDNVLSYLQKSPDESFDAFSLSDVSSYLSKEQFDALTKEIYRTARPNARFCMRQFLSNHQISPQLEQGFVRNRTLEEELEQEDRSFIYRFLTGHIEKNC